jgi:hypothetical protein
MSEGALQAVVSDVSPQPITPMALIQQAQAGGSSIEQMQQLFDLQMRWEENEARKAYNDAIAKFKQEDIFIVKDATVHFQSSKGTTHYTHATLGGVVGQVTPMMSKHGLSHSWNTQQNGGSISVTCKISHRLGHSESVTLFAGADNSGNKNSIQQIGSTVTYLQRYTLLSALGLATSDDDGQGSEPTERESSCVAEAVKKNPKYMDAGRFALAFPIWRERVLFGGKTPYDIIARAEEQGVTFLPEQLEAINTIRPEDRP